MPCPSDDAPDQRSPRKHDTTISQRLTSWISGGEGASAPGLRGFPRHRSRRA
ncbi:hypothetical protein DVS28_a3504 [Euzebya pacifica]|uniref:Uncharacterized protein n=1 Tax=Euzebya pacifica TaxID=1608957 RepID=A0A346Y130_9ACTN|nr:hypothetical protein DVS28_a3504 [Euzebya pacifica]